MRRNRSACADRHRFVTTAPRAIRPTAWPMRSGGAAADFDAVVIAGDHIDAFLPVPSAVPIAALSASFAAVARKSRVLVCSGNHDLDARNAEGEKTADWLGAVRSSVLAVDGHSPTAVLCGHIHEAPMPAVRSAISRPASRSISHSSTTLHPSPRRYRRDHRADAKREIEHDQAADAVERLRRLRPGSGGDTGAQPRKQHQIDVGEHRRHDRPQGGHDMPTDRCLTNAGSSKHDATAGKDDQHRDGRIAQEARERGSHER